MSLYPPNGRPGNHILPAKRFNRPINTNMIPRAAVGPALDLFKKAGIPFFASQDESARAMHALFRYSRIRSNSK